MLRTWLALKLCWCQIADPENSASDVKRRLGVVSLVALWHNNGRSYYSMSSLALGIVKCIRDHSNSAILVSMTSRSISGEKLRIRCGKCGVVRPWSWQTLGVFSSVKVGINVVATAYEQHVERIADTESCSGEA